MGKRTKHPPGTFSWVDLATTDVAAAKTFYSSLFGWDAEDTDANGVQYTFFRIDGDAICGLSALTDEMRTAGVPPAWTSYVTVPDADVATTRAAELGGAAMSPAFDVGDAGRMAVLADPQGGAFAVWQPRAQIGAERVNDLGCLCMNELATTDIPGARRFYEGLFGWTTDLVDTGPDGPEIVEVKNGATLNANISAAEGGASPHWRPYFTVESTESAVARVEELDGRLIFGPFPIPDGSIAIAVDPQGALFALFAGETDP